MDKIGIGFITRNLVDDMYFIGVTKIRSWNTMDGGLYGSGRELKKDILDLGRENFVSEIHAEFETEEEMTAWIQDQVDEAAVRDPQCYNMRLGNRSPSPVGGSE